MLEQSSICRYEGGGQGSWPRRDRGQGPNSLNMAFSLRKQQMKLSKSKTMLSFPYLATSTWVILLFTLMPGGEGSVEVEESSPLTTATRSLHPNSPPDPWPPVFSIAKRIS